MGLMKRAVLWLSFCAFIATSVNLILVTRAPTPSAYSHRKGPTPSPSESVKFQETDRPKIYIQGEIYCLRDSEYHKKREKQRSGLKLLNDVYKHLTTIDIEYSSLSPHLNDLVESLKLDLTRRWVTDDPWDLAKKWASHTSLVPEKAKGLGDILAAMNGAPIIATDVGYKGTQLKVMVLLKGGQKAVFKPQWYTREEVIEGEVYAGADRHNGEIAAFHLSRLLGMPMVPLAVGRKVSLKRDILGKATKKLAKTFYTKGKNICFYGVCYYCRKEASVCDEKGSLEGTMILWLPVKIPLTHLPHPWARTYKKDKFSHWEENKNYCDKVLSNSMFDMEKSSRLLDLMDTTVFDFLLQNGDRHHYTIVSDQPDSSVVLLDNGKSFADPYVDHMDVLAPLIQCCRLRQTTYERLVLLSGGGLSHALSILLSQDPIKPILLKPHLLALDRRVNHILATLSMCKDQFGGWHNVLF